MLAPVGASAISRGLGFLARHQLPWGQFNIDYAEERPDLRRTLMSADHSPFATSHIVSSLAFSDRPEARAMIDRAIHYLKAEMVGPGLWRYWNKSHPRHGFIPPDLDDTACISYLLRRHGVPMPDNRPLFLLNRDAGGLFYTYLIPRAVRTTDLSYWKAVLGDLNPSRAYFFWAKTAARRDDVDAVVNANVLLYLGEGPDTQPVIDWLVDILRAGREATSDKWYLDPFTFYYAVSRCHGAGIGQFDRVRALIVDRILQTRQPDGCLGEHVLDTALGVNALLTFGVDPHDLCSSVSFVLQAQQDYGSWRRYPFYFGGPKRPAWWGSEELTTGLCVEALERTDPAVLARVEEGLSASPPRRSHGLVRSGSARPWKSLLGMTSWYERAHYDEVARDVVKGVGDIVDLGSWLGSTTVSLAAGLAENPNVEARKRKIVAFDRFLWEEYMNGVVRGTELENRYRAGDSFLDEFKRRLGRFADRVDVRAGDLLQASWPDTPIEVLLVDAMKTPDLANAVLSHFYPSLIPGASLVIHQDFAHIMTWWIHLIHYRLRHYFEPFADVQRSGTTTFRLTSQIPRERLTGGWNFQAVDDEEIDRAFAYSLGLTTDPFKKGQIAGAHVVAYLDRGHTGRARAVSNGYVARGVSIQPDSQSQLEFIVRHGILQG